MRAYPLQKRFAVLAAYAAGKKTRQIAKELVCSESWARRVKQKRNTPRFIVRSRTRHRTPRWVVYSDEIKALMHENPAMTLVKLKAALNTDLSIQTLCRALNALDVSKYMPRDWRDRV
jgi:transposase